MTKEKLRQKYKAKRQKLSDADVCKLSQQIFENFRASFNFEGKSISIFVPIERFKEVNTWEFLNNYSANYFLPVVNPNGLQHVKFESIEQLQETDWGILEPNYGETATAKLFDLVIVPLLAYDADGNRVGYGKGFYDSFLKNCASHCQFIGLSYFEPEQNSIATIPSDIRLHYCITPKKVHQFKKTI
ncbi:MAG: 5-formyltetrahydrofolate cyclo-ligase [Crocinitomicaceae bacterium]